MTAPLLSIVVSSLSIIIFPFAHLLASHPRRLPFVAAFDPLEDAPVVEDVAGLTCRRVGDRVEADRAELAGRGWRDSEDREVGHAGYGRVSSCFAGFGSCLFLVVLQTSGLLAPAISHPRDDGGRQF